jgi:hypothetical protein
MIGYKFWYHGTGCPAGEILWSAESDDWTQFGFRVDDEGNPVVDSNRNMVFEFAREECDIPLNVAWELYAGADSGGAEPRDRVDFERWLGERIGNAEWATLLAD